jgi:hypothetical protein
MYIVISGEVGIYVDGGLSECVARLRENYIFGERALQTQALRGAWVVAHMPTICLALEKSDFNKQIYFRENLQSIVRLQFMIEHPFCEGWPLDRVKIFSRLMSFTKLSACDTIYDIGHHSNVIYFIKSGSIQMESIVEIEHQVKYPTSYNTWEVKKTKSLADYEVRKFHAGEVFGHQEVIEYEI